MEHPGFFELAGPFSLGEVARVTESQLAAGADENIMIDDVRSLSDCGPTHLAFLDNKKYLPQLPTTPCRRLPDPAPFC